MVSHLGLFHPPRLLFALVVFRICNALLINTFFDPDEYWQSLEVAHSAVFGYGYLTWEWAERIRGVLHPSLFAVLYYLLALLGLDSAWAIIWFPRIFQGGLAALLDYYTYVLGRRCFGETLVLSVCSWFQAYCLVRTYSNSLEAVLLIAALAQWPFASLPSLPSSSRPRALLLAALGVVVRPTSAVTWITLGLKELWRLDGRGRLRLVLGEVLPLGLLTLLLSTFLDSAAYGQWTVAPLRFLEVNVFSGVASQYGTHPWWWYLGAAVPLELATFFPLLLLGLSRAGKSTELLLLLGTNLVLFSSLPHKELRFLLPLLPPLLILCASALPRLLSSSSSPRLLLLLLLLPQALLAAYFGQVHQRGAIAIMSDLRDLPPTSSLLFLTPCHATPFYSHLHQPLRMDFIPCPPDLGRPKDLDLVTRRDFESDPLPALRLLLAQHPYSHLVLADNYLSLPHVEEHLAQAGFKPLLTRFHAHWGDVRSFLLLGRHH